MKKGLVSIIVPLYNSANYIKECLESCTRQSYQNIEVIVVDDGSTDSGASIAGGVAKNNSKVKVFRNANKGVSFSRNYGMDQADGEYICFIDADDVIEKTFVEKMVGYLDKYDADFCYSSKTWTPDQKSASARLISSVDAEMALLGPRIKVGCWNKMYRKKTIEGIKFDTNLFYGEGLMFILQVAHRTKKIVECEDRLYHYRTVNPESATKVFDIEKVKNGEKSLLDIKKIIKGDGIMVNRVWSGHYCLFCMNAMKGLLRSERHKKNDYQFWHKKMKKHYFSALRSKCGLKIKLKMTIAFISPRLYEKIVK